jgi:long-chain acyl-CoA synthetase
MIYTNDLSKFAFIAPDNKYTYEDLLKGVSFYAEYTKNCKADKVAIFAKNSVHWVFSFFAGWHTGHTIVPIDFLSSKEDILHILNDCKPGLVFHDDTTVDLLKETVSEIDFDIDIQQLSSESKFANEPVKWEGPEDDEKTAVIIYTSGTTGSPKGVELSYTNIIANITAVSEKVPIYKEDQQVLMLLPLHHIFPLVGSMVMPLYIGGTVVESPSMQSADLLKTFNDNQIGLMIGVPKLYKLLYQGISDKINKSFIGRALYSTVKTFKARGLARKIFKQVHQRFGGNLTFLISGGAALEPHVAKFFHTLGFTILEGFGMTEAAPMITFTRPGNFKPGSCGQALPGLTLAIKDEEIIAKGPNVMKGYYNRPEETADVIKDGWLHTGDLGRIDKKGRLYITGRKKDIIVLPSGKNINPVLLEQKLEKDPHVSEAALFLNKNFLHALIIPNLEKITEENIENVDLHFRKQVLPKFNKEVTSFKRIMKFALITGELPRTRLGKIQRFKLPELFEKPTDSIVDIKGHAESEEYIVIKSFIEQQVDMTIDPNHHVEFDIAMDSLDKLTLMEFIDRTFGVKFDEEKLRKFPSVGKMAEYIKHNKLFQKIEMPDWSSIIKEKVNIKLPKSWFSQILLIKGLKYLFLLFFRLKSKGKENIPEGPAIIAPNHQSYLDAFFATAFLQNKELRQTFFYAKRKHVKSKFMNFMAGKHNVIVVDLADGLKESIQKLASVLKEQKKVVIFPEGTRTSTGKIGDFKKTFAILSKELNVPIVPVAIDGAYRALPKGKKIPRLFTKVQVTYMPPVYPGSADFDELADKVKNKIAEEVYDD